MKFKPANNNTGGMVVELGAGEAQMPTPASEAPAVFNLKRILVPVDFSDCSKKALDYAVPLARQFGASITLLHSVPAYLPVPDLLTVDLLEVENQIRQTSQEHLEEMQETVEAGVETRVALRSGDPQVEIVAAAAELDIDLIILSTHGRTGMAHVLLGSTAERVIRHAGCPVLIVREREHEFVSSRQTKI